MGAVFAALWSFVNSPLGMSLIVTPAVAWLLKQVAKQTSSARATALANYAYKACEAVESLHMHGFEKYERALALFKDSVLHAGLVKADKKTGRVGLTAAELALFEQLAKQFAMSKKPPAPKVVTGKK